MASSSVKCPLAGSSSSARATAIPTSERASSTDNEIFERMSGLLGGVDGATLTTRRSRISSTIAPLRAFQRRLQSIPGAWRKPAHRSPTSARRAGSVSDREGARIEGLVVRALPRRAASTPRRSRWRARCRAGQRLAADVLQAVDVDGLGVAFVDGPLDRGRLRVLVDHEGSHDLAKKHPRLVRGAGAKRQEDVQPARAGGLQPARDPQRVELVVRPSARRRARVKTAPRPWDRDRSPRNPSPAATARGRTTGPGRSPPAAPCAAAWPDRRRRGAPARRRRCRPARSARRAGPARARAAGRRRCRRSRRGIAS